MITCFEDPYNSYCPLAFIINGPTSEQIGVDASTNNQINEWISKAVKSNKNLYLANVNKTFNNHQLQWLRANALYGLIWNDSKALKKSHKGLKKFLKGINKNGVMKEEAIRGSRGLWYTGRAFHAIFSISEFDSAIQ